MRAPRAEVDNAAASGCFDNTRRFGCRQALKMYLVQHKGFHHLRLEDWRNHLHQRLVWKYGCEQEFAKGGDSDVFR
jgi:hypothetical protein